MKKAIIPPQELPQKAVFSRPVFTGKRASTAGMTVRSRNSSKISPWGISFFSTASPSGGGTGSPMDAAVSSHSRRGLSLWMPTMTAARPVTSRSARTASRVYQQP